MWVYFNIEGRQGTPVRIIGKYGTESPVTIMTYDTLLQLNHFDYTELPDIISIYSNEFKYLGLSAKAWVSLTNEIYVKVYVTKTHHHNNWICIGKCDEERFKNCIFPCVFG